jgi:hypothetical protein
MHRNTRRRNLQELEAFVFRQDLFVSIVCTGRYMRRFDASELTSIDGYGGSSNE